MEAQLVVFCSLRIPWDLVLRRGGWGRRALPPAGATRLDEVPWAATLFGLTPPATEKTMPPVAGEAVLDA